MSPEKKQSSEYESFGHKTKNVSFWIPIDTLNIWDAFADIKGVNRTELIKRAVDTFMENKKALNGEDRIQDLEAKLTEKINMLDTKLERHVIDFDAIMNDLFASGSVTAGLVAKRSGQILYISSDWAVDEKDLKNCIDNWQYRAKFVKLQGVKYSILLSQPEYFTAINPAEKSWLVGACSPEESGERYFVLGFAPAGTDDGKNAYVDVGRAANRMKASGSYKATDESLGKYSAADIATGKPWYDTFDDDRPRDPALRQEINAFLEWVQDANGLDAWIAHYLDINDPDWSIVARLAKTFKEIQQEFDLKSHGMKVRARNASQDGERHEHE